MRDYCDQKLHEGLNEMVDAFLRKLNQLQERLREKDAMKARMKRRLQVLCARAENGEWRRAGFTNRQCGEGDAGYSQTNVLGDDTGTCPPWLQPRLELHLASPCPPRPSLRVVCLAISSLVPNCPSTPAPRARLIPDPPPLRAPLIPTSCHIRALPQLGASVAIECF